MNREEYLARPTLASATAEKSEYQRGHEAGLAEAALLLERELNYWRRERRETNDFRGGIDGILSRLRHLQNIITYEQAEVFNGISVEVEKDIADYQALRAQAAPLPPIATGTGLRAGKLGRTRVGAYQT